MTCAFWYVWVIVLLICWPILAVAAWLVARPCPKCGSRDTTVIGEWGDEQYQCWAEGCGHSWFVPYPDDPEHPAEDQPECPGDR